MASPDCRTADLRPPSFHGAAFLFSVPPARISVQRQLAGEAVDQGLALAKTLGARVTAVVVTEPLALMVGNEAFHHEAIGSNAKSVLAPVRDAAEKNGVACEIIRAKAQHPAEGIIQTAQEKGCDLIVMTSHSRRLTKALMGRLATKVLTYSSVPVLVCR